MHAPYARTVLAGAILFSSLSAVAQTSPVTLGDTVVSASGFEQKITDAPASISVISGEELQKKRVSNLAEALNDVEGVDVTSSGGKLGGLNVSIRGTGSQYTLILVDGKRQNISANITPNAFDDARTAFLPPVSAIERIEVIRGPMSTLYGSDAMGGVINIITKKVSPEWTGSISADTTLQEHKDYSDARGTNAYLSGPLIPDTLGLTLRGKYQERQAATIKGKNAAGQNALLAQSNNPGEADLWSAGGRLSFTPGEDHEILFDYDISKQNYANDDSNLGTQGAAGGYEDEQRFEREQYSLSYTGRLAFGTLETAVTRNTSETFGRIVPTALTTIPGVTAGGARTLEGENTIFDVKLLSSIGDHNFTIGGQHWKTVADNGLNGQELDATIKSLFVEDEWRILDSLALTLGVRRDQHSSFGGHTSPRAYLVWNTTDNWTLKGGISKAFRAPNVDQLINGIADIRGQGHSPVNGDPGLKPETSVSKEFGVYFDNLQGFNANLTLFRNDFKDKLGEISQWNCEAPIGDGTGGTRIGSESCVTIPGGPWYDNWSRVQYNNTQFSQYANLDEVTTEGVEVAASWQFAPAWKLSANYTYTDTEQKSGVNKGWPLNETPRNLANLRLDWQATDNLSTWLRSEYRGERFRRTSATPNMAYEALGDYKAYTLFHLGGSYRISDNLDVSATIYNLFDTNFSDYKRHANNAAGTAFTYSNQYHNVQERRRLWLSTTYSF
ncbi:TonB-dependent receptor domain-containing protein [Pseudomonas lopnurensis]|uniref:TonB-dependent receptor domain-containing protein n=1 Tax=Pseudomonas lopnurensis TaxID=1477517 RepID=UPI0028ACC47B|nr:TonB-dependent receptor [Pseudomonas lopnurensis]